MQNALYSAGFAPPSTDEYKTKKLVLRKIEKGTYVIGGEICEGGINTKHNVNMPRDYYVAIFELTECQYNRLMLSATPGTSLLPKGNISWNTVRGSAGVKSSPGDGCLKTLNDKCTFNGSSSAQEGVFDLPTASMWEVAARAGTSTSYLWGDAPTTEGKNIYAWWSGYSGGSAHTVGTKQPNNWGLWDTCGNRHEIMLDMAPGDNVDYATAAGSSGFEPVSTSTNKSGYRIFKGGSLGGSAWSFQSYTVEAAGSASANYGGIRVSFVPKG